MYTDITTHYYFNDINEQNDKLIFNISNDFKFICFESIELPPIAIIWSYDGISFIDARNEPLVLAVGKIHIPTYNVHYESVISVYSNDHILLLRELKEPLMLKYRSMRSAIYKILTDEEYTEQAKSVAKYVYDIMKRYVVYNSVDLIRDILAVRADDFIRFAPQNMIANIAQTAHKIGIEAEKIFVDFLISKKSHILISNINMLYDLLQYDAAHELIDIWKREYSDLFYELLNKYDKSLDSIKSRAIYGMDTVKDFEAVTRLGVYAIHGDKIKTVKDILNEKYGVSYNGCYVRTGYVDRLTTLFVESENPSNHCVVCTD